MDHRKINFKESLVIGKEGETFVKNYFIKQYDAITGNDDYKYDLKFYKNNKSLLVEVKKDFMMLNTGNIAIECYSRDNSSGIHTTESDYWIQLDKKNNMYIINTNELKNICYKKKQIQTRNEDSNNKIYLVPAEEYKQYRINSKEFLTLI